MTRQDSSWEAAAARARAETHPSKQMHLDAADKHWQAADRAKSSAARKRHTEMMKYHLDEAKKAYDPDAPVRRNPRPLTFSVAFEIEFEDYFQGAGTGDYDNVVTGIGSSAEEALEDAFEVAADQEDGPFTENEEEQIEARAIKKLGSKDFKRVHKLGDGEWVYCIIRYSFTDGL